MATTQTSSGDDSHTRDDSRTTRLLQHEYGIDPTDRRCKCGSTDVTYVRKTKTPLAIEVEYNCSECADDNDSEWDTLIPLAYARARLTSTNQYEYVSIYDERARMNGAEYA